MTVNPPYLQVNSIHKSHDGLPTLNGISLSLTEGEILCLLGPSGCGKTTLLRIIAGLEKPDQGTVLFDGNDLAPIPPYRRQFSMMFQEFALFPHKSVSENISFGPEMQHLSRDRIDARTQEMVKLVGLEGKEKRSIGELSGGERQRVALARSLAPSPRLLMLDEPMGSLDRALRERLTLDLRQILKTVNVTTLFVTHDQNEAFILADRIAVINNGSAEQVDTPTALYRAPANEFVARFLGFQNLFPVTGTDTGLIETPVGSIPFFKEKEKIDPATLLLIRPEAARIIKSDNPCRNDEIEVNCNVIDCRFQGAVHQVQVKCNGAAMVFHLPWEEKMPKTGETLTLALKKSAMSLLPQH